MDGCALGHDHGPQCSYALVAEAFNSSGSAFSAGVSSPFPTQVTNYTAPGIDNPADITAGPDGALWFTNSGTFDPTTKTFIGSSIGRITTVGVVTTYTDPSIDGPEGITAGPDGALWFTNDGYLDGKTPRCLDRADHHRGSCDRLPALWDQSTGG